MRLLVLALGLTLMLTPVARAQDAATPQDVHDLLAAAVAEYDGGNYEEAYALFLRVHQLQPSARSQRALGKAAFELLRYRECVTWLDASLTDTRSPLTDDMRTEVNGLLARARAFVGRFVVHMSVEGATLDVDGAPADGTTIQLDLGDHTIVARATGYADAARRVSVHGGEDETLELTLMSTGDRAGPVAREDPGAIFRDLGLVSLVTGAIFAVGGAIATGIWANAVGNLNANIQAGVCAADPGTESIVLPSNPTCVAQQNQYRIALPFQYVGYIGAGVFLATGLGLILGAPSASEGAQAVTVRCGPYADVGASCHVTF